ncbi:GNAT family N-acetyltransferase [uncultured Variovorax sp.]|uniref:GNAT family N-acetyltransferase n=1 Tax=uncultured Variovorax sp. TaxID=114708 RepID=UPI0025D0F312|nr:GNAT family N-acetyltransferase [uncultured Variovorax sp.]
MAEHAVETLESIAPGIDPDAARLLDALVAASGWNQTAHDWRLFARLGTIHVVRDGQGRIAASGAVLPMEGASWISMILVRPEARGQGLGRAVFEHCLRQVKDAGLVAMLDATPQGEPIYASAGFAPLWRLTRWQRDAVEGSAAPAAAQAMPSPEGLAALCALDAQALGIARPGVLADLLAREGSRCVRNAAGLGLVRTGRTAHHIGPLLAADERTAAMLLQDALAGISGRVYIDVPDGRHLMTQALHDAGFAPQRGFVRMALATRPDTVAPAGQPAFIHAIAGPEYG